MSITLPEYSGCVWPLDPGCLTDEWDALDPDVQARAVMLASSALESLTARRVSNCPITVRPCRSTHCASFSPGIVRPGVWANNCGCSESSACKSGCEITLRGPVGRVDEIVVGGQPMNLDDFRLDNGNILVYQGDGMCPFDMDQNLSLPKDAEGAWYITYLNAYPVDARGALAAGYLAMEFAKACAPKGKCALPRGVTNVVRNGLSFEVQAGLFPDGNTNIEIVDEFIQSWNPQGRRQASKVWSPDRNSPRRTRALR